MKLIMVGFRTTVVKVKEQGNRLHSLGVPQEGYLKTECLRQYHVLNGKQTNHDMFNNVTNYNFRDGYNSHLKKLCMTDVEWPSKKS